MARTGSDRPDAVARTARNQSTQTQAGSSFGVEGMVVVDLPFGVQITVSCIVPQDIIEIDEDENPAGIVITGEKNPVGLKKKAPMGYNKNWQKEIKLKEALANDLMSFNTPLETTASFPWNPLKNYGPVSQDLNYSDVMDIDYEVSLAAQFDAIDQPPWVEMSIPWLQQPAAPTFCASSSRQLSEPTSSRKKEESSNEIATKFKSFKQFDTVHDFSDHHYTKLHQRSRESFHVGSLTKKTPIGWTKKIQQEWKILEKDLPGNLFCSIENGGLLDEIAGDKIFMWKRKPREKDGLSKKVREKENSTMKERNTSHLLSRDLKENYSGDCSSLAKRIRNHVLSRP
ncbi:hypothetical protein ACLOJK_010770 [Asimina triloba]